MRKRLLPYAMLAMAFALSILAACAQLGVASPETFNEKALFALATVTEIRNGAGTLLGGGKISAAEAQTVQNQADNARQAIDLARATHSTDPAGADSRLAATITVLNGLRAYLATHGK